MRKYHAKYLEKVLIVLVKLSLCHHAYMFGIAPFAPVMAIETTIGLLLLEVDVSEGGE